MSDTLPLPLFVPAADSLHDLSGEEAVSRLLLAVSRCKKFVSDGRRIENISWRIWFHDYHHPANPSQGEIHILDVAPLCQEATPVTPEKDYEQPSAHIIPLLTPSSPPRSISPITENVGVFISNVEHAFGFPLSGNTITSILKNKLDLTSMKRRSHKQQMAENQSPPSTAPILRIASTSSTPRGGTSLAPRLVIVNPTPHPTPPATPHNRQPPSSLSNRICPAQFLAPLEMPPPMRVSDLALGPITGTSRSSSSSSKDSSSTTSSNQPITGRLFFVCNAPESASPEKPMPLTPAPTLPTPLDEPKEVQDTPEPEPDVVDMNVTSRRDTSSATSSGSILTQSHKSKEGRGSGHSRSRSRAKFSMGGSSRSSTSGPKLRAHEIAQAKKAASGTPGSVESRRHFHHQHGSRFDGGSRARPTNGSKHSRRASAQLSKRGSPEARAILQRVQTQPLPQAHRALRNYGNAVKVPAHHLAQPLVPRTTSKKRVELVSTSSEDESEDGSEWSSVREEDEEPTKPPDKEPADTSALKKVPDQLSQAAAEAARQREFFRKRPPSEYIDSAKRHQAGLLTNLFRPDPNLFPEGHPYRTSLSHHDLVAKAGVPGRGPTLYYGATQSPSQVRVHHPAAPQPQMQRLRRLSPPSTASRLSSSRSAVALPELANVTVGSIATGGVISPSKSTTTVGTQSTIRSNGTKDGYRPRGRPADVELSDSDEDDDPENSVQMETSIAHQRLAEIAQQRRRSQPPQADNRLPQPQPQTANGKRAPQIASADPTPVLRARPVAIGYPYNLPAPTPPLSPSAQRQRMYWEECGISLLKHMNHEQAEGYGLLHEGVRFVKDKRTRVVQAQERRNRLQRNKSWAADDFHTRGW